MKFQRLPILKEVIVTVECLEFDQDYKLTRPQADPQLASKAAKDGSYYLLAIFDAIMNAMAKANGKNIWMCKSMGMSQYHEMLLKLYGKERLRYIYLVRDPRDVCLSFIKTPVGDCHPFAITKKWVKLQYHAGRIIQENPELLHQVRYEDVLHDRESEVSKVFEFMGSRNMSRTMRRGSVVGLMDEEHITTNAKGGRDAKGASELSYQFKNLTRGTSMIKTQFKKWAYEMDEDTLRIVESIAFTDMKKLEYEPHIIKTNKKRINFAEDVIQEYTKLNADLIVKMYCDLENDNPADFDRRQVQAAVLKADTSVRYDNAFISLDIADRDYVIDLDDIPNDNGIKLHSLSNFDFCLWPKNASRVGFMSDKEVAERFEIEETQTLKLGNNMTLTFAAASQGGYYPSDKTKHNQDAFFVVGATVQCSHSNKKCGSLFSVFDGHGTAGAECARFTRDYVHFSVVSNIQNIQNGFVDPSSMSPFEPGNKSKGDMVSSKKHDGLSSSIVAAAMTNAYLDANNALDENEDIDAESSGTTATSLFVTKNGLHVANVGDSRCLLVSYPKKNGQPKHSVLTNDHSPDREDEQERIKAHGGVIMSSDQYDVNDDQVLSFEPKRVWSKEGKWPGTAFTRSIGDIEAKELGVCADPECSMVPTPDNDSIFILGSDGIFDFISNDEVSIIASYYHDPADACRALTGMAYNRWSKSEERSDDISIIVGHIKHAPGKIFGGLRRALKRNAM